MMAFRVIAYVSLFLWMSIRPGFAQVPGIDSLESLVRSIPVDTNKVWLLNNLVSSLREKDNHKALQYANLAIELSELLGYRKGLAHALENAGWIHYRKGDYAKSFELSSRALEMNEQLGDRRAATRCLINIAAIHYEQKQFDVAVRHFREAYRASVEAGDVATMARSSNNLAFGFLEMAQLDSAYKHAVEALSISQKVGDPYLTAFALRTIGDVYLERKDYESALDNFRQCLQMSEKEGNSFVKVSTLHRIGRVYHELGQFGKAIPYLLEDVQIAQRYGYREELERTSLLLSKIYHSMNDIRKAYMYQSRYLSIHDSLNEQRMNERMTLQQARFNDQIKEAKIELLTKEAELHEKEIRSQKIWLYFSAGGVSLLVILAFVLFYSNRYNSLAKKQLQEKNDAINIHTEQLRNLNATKDKLFSIISHDLRGPIASLKAVMELVGTPGFSQEEFVSVTRMLKRNLDSVHEDLDNLLMWAQSQLKGFQAVPEALDVHALADEKIKLYIESANAKNITITNSIPPGTTVVADRNHIKLVMRNLLANAVKFNKPGGTIVVSSRNCGDMHEISVSDSGIGINYDDMAKLFNAETHFTRPGTNKEKGIGIGLLITKEFIERNHGSIWVKSEPGKGTTFTFSLKADPERVLV